METDGNRQIVCKVLASEASFSTTRMTVRIYYRFLELVHSLSELRNPEKESRLNVVSG